MNEEFNEIDKSAVLPTKYKFFTKKVEKVLTLIFLVLFFITFDKSLFSPLSIVLYILSIICVLYYILFFRKKTAYIILEDDCIIIARGIFLKDEKIKTDSIKKIYILDKKIEIVFTKEDTEDKENNEDNEDKEDKEDNEDNEDNVTIFNILLEENDRAAITTYLQSKQT